MPKERNPKRRLPPPLPFDQIGKKERAEWRAHPVTRAFRAHLVALQRALSEQLVAAAEKGQGGASVAGQIRALEVVDRELLADPAERVIEEEDPFVDPADITEELAS